MQTKFAHSFVLALALGAAAATPAEAQLFGPSKEEVAREAQQDSNDSELFAKAADQDNKINALNDRLRDLEAALRQATGNNEVLQNRITQLSQQIDRQQRDFEYRLCVLTAKQLGTSADGSDGGINCAASTANINAAAPSNERFAGGAVALPPPGGGSLGTLPSTASSSPRVGAGGTAQSRFDAAMALLGRNQMDEARGAFRAFADTYPEDPQAAAAIYWVGVIAYTQNDYANAARTFAEGIKKYPTSSRGPDTMLKLGQSLIAMGQKNEGCTTLGAIKQKYPQASPAVLNQATNERRDAACR